MTKGQSGANAPDRNRGREQPPGPRHRATYEDRTGTNKDNKINIKEPKPAPLPMPAAS